MPHGLRAVDVHPAGTLQDGLEDDCGDLARVPLEQRGRFFLPPGQVGVEAARRSRREHVLRDQVAVHRVHAALGVAHAHAGEGVPVVATADGEHPRSSWPRLPRHLHRDFDGDRPRIGEEHLVQPRGRHLDQAPTQLHGRLVGKATEHHVAHPVELGMCRRVQFRYGVAVDRAPPRRHRVDDLDRFTVHQQMQPGSRGRLHDERCQRTAHGRVRVPQMIPIEAQQVHVDASISPCSTHRTVQWSGVTYTTIGRPQARQQRRRSRPSRRSHTSSGLWPRRFPQWPQ